MSEYTTHRELVSEPAVALPEPSVPAEEVTADNADEVLTNYRIDDQEQLLDEAGGNDSPSQMEVAGAILLVDLSAVRPSPDNPNHHTTDQIELLARNVKRHGLRNAIELKRVADDNDHQYEILSGEGRYRAYCHLRDTEATAAWTRIPAIIRDDDVDAGEASGRRLSENTLRWFNWAAECVEAASLKASGADLKTLMESFGYGKTVAANLVAAGQCLSMIDVTKDSMFRLTGTLTREDFIKFVVPLRVSREKVQSEKGKKGFRQADPSAYDYTEVKACVKALLSNELKREDLPQYSQEHRPSAKTQSLNAVTERQGTRQAGQGTEEPSHDATLPYASVAEQSESGHETVGEANNHTGTTDLLTRRAQLTAAERGRTEAQNKTTPRVAPESWDANHCTPALQVAAGEPADSRRKTERHQVSGNPTDWILNLLSNADLTGVTWILMGQGTPPSSEWAGSDGPTHLFIHPDVAGQRSVQKRAHGRASLPSEDTMSAYPPDRKPCFGRHPDYCSYWSDKVFDLEACEACGQRIACQEQTCRSQLCFGEHPEDAKGPYCRMCSQEKVCMVTTEILKGADSSTESTPNV